MLIKMPETWPQPLVATIAMVVLALLDLGGTFAAKEAVERRSTAFALVGVVLFVLLFWVYACSLQYAELSLVTLGWIVVLQVGVLLLDKFRYGAQLTSGAWVAIVVIFAAQAYLILGARSSTPDDAPQKDRVTSGVSSPA